MLNTSRVLLKSLTYFNKYADRYKDRYKDGVAKDLAHSFESYWLSGADRNIGVIDCVAVRKGEISWCDGYYPEGM